MIRPIRPVVVQNVQDYEDRPASCDATGFRYTSAHDEGPCVALWETSPPLVVAQDRPLCDPSLFRRFTTAMRKLKIES